MSGCLTIIIILLIIGFLLSNPILLFAILIPILIWKIYEWHYFKSDKFLAIKDRIQTYIKDCNELNRHVQELKNTQLVIHRTEDAGHADFSDESNWKMKRPHMSKQTSAQNVFECSRAICDNARKAPFKYVCKYFGVAADEPTLEAFEKILNNFEAAEDGKKALQKERDSIISGVQSEIPSLILKLSPQKLSAKLGFDPIDLEAIKYPQYIFKYISSGGNASTQCAVTMDIPNLNEFILFLSEKIRFKKSAAGQRALMTSRLRQQIKQRDNFTCKHCGVSLEQEPHLLLEIDHIVPISRGGLTEESNLQTLCWRCNRSKGAKI